MIQILLFNPDRFKLGRLQVIFVRLGLKWKIVPPEDFSASIGSLLGLPVSSEKSPAAPFSEEMMLMHALDSRAMNTLLESMRRQKLSVSLKAVATPDNISWTPAKLYAELSAERAAFAAGKSIHQKT